MITELDAMNQITRTLTAQIAKLSAAQRQRTLLWLASWVQDQLEQEDHPKADLQAVPSS